MSATIRTYYCGEGGTVRRLDDLTTPWTSVNVPNQQVVLNDIKTDPTNKDKVFTVGTGNTIYVSSNAGGAWTLAGGTYGSTFLQTQWYEVWPVTTSNIVVCGEAGFIAKSTDGGLTFSNLSALPTPSGTVEPGKTARAIHFPTTSLGVVGFEDKVFLTTNGGTSWTFCNSGLGLIGTTPGVTSFINGIHVDQTGQIITVHGNTDIWRSTNAGASFISVYSYTHFGNGKHLTWFDDNNLWGTGDYNEMTRSTNGGATWALTRTGFPSVSSNNAAHFFRLTNGLQIDGFWNSGTRVFSTNNAGLTGSPSDNSPVIVNAIWTLIQSEPCYKLLNCDGRPIPIIVNDDLAQYVGSVVQIEGQCFQVELSDTCEGAITLFPGQEPSLPQFSSCDKCNPPDCFELTDCTNQTPVLIFSYKPPGPGIDLSQYENQVIKLCKFTSSPVIPLVQLQSSCPLFPGIFSATIEQVTGPTSGYYYNFSSTPGSPYGNPGMLSVVSGSAVCLVIGSPPTISLVQAVPVYTIQFFIGTTPITNPIYINQTLSAANLEFIINQQIIFPLTTITVNYFTSLGVNFNVVTHTPITDTTLTITVSPSISQQTSFTEEITGSCICYTVKNIGPCEFELEPPPPLEDPVIGCFPDCECCLGPPPPEPEPPYIPTPPEIDKGTYRICESQCDIDANTSFASAMYDKFKTDAYGIAQCCNINTNLAWIRKELSDLSKINC